MEQKNLKKGIGQGLARQSRNCRGKELGVAWLSQGLRCDQVTLNTVDRGLDLMKNWKCKGEQLRGGQPVGGLHCGGEGGSRMARGGARRDQRGSHGFLPKRFKVSIRPSRPVGR